MNEGLIKNSPFADIDYRFSDYVSKKKNELAKKMDGNGLPNYAYSMDYQYRKRIDSIPGIFKLAHTVCSTYVPQALQQYNMQGVMVGPGQFPEIYEMVKDCARILGIGVPNVLVVGKIDKDEFNACTIAADDVEPIIIVTGLMVQRTTPGELKAVIGHECGHIHNYHGVYSILARLIANIGMSGLLSMPGLRQFTGLLTNGVQMAFNMWSRAAEVTADRAGLICCDRFEDAYNVDKKLIYGGANLSGTVDINLDLDSLREQMDMLRSNPYRFYELYANHPIGVKRIFAEMDFVNCETLYEWRPEMRQPGQRLISKKETDEKVKRYIDVVRGKGAKK